jgi:hypothetical protein
MWVLVYILSYSVTPTAQVEQAQWILAPSVVFQEFSSEDRCKQAKALVDSTLHESVSSMREGLEEVGKVGGVFEGTRFVYKVECLQK